MPSVRAWADLHLHTLWSDGTLDIAETALRAKGMGLACIAITDHDTISPELSAPVQKIAGVEVICGAEIKVDLFGVRAEVLGYFLDPRSPALRELFHWMKRARRERMQAMIRRCNELLGLDLDFRRVAARARDSVGRPHLAQALVEAGVVPSLEEAFRRYLADGMPCYVPLPRPEVAEVIRIIRSAGGVAALAHPGILQLDDWEGILRRLKEAGMDAIEIHYPYRALGIEPEIAPERLAELARNVGLISTGGSDDHGPGSGKETMGTVRIPYATVERLAALAPSTA